MKRVVMMTPVFEGTPDTPHDSSNPPSGRIDGEMRNQGGDDRVGTSYTSSSAVPQGRPGAGRRYHDTHLS